MATVALSRAIDVVDEDGSEDDAIVKSEFLSILANRHRLHILFLLSKSEHSLSELSRELSETTIALSRHLMILRENNIISGRRHGKMVLYSLTCPRMMRMIETIADLYVPRAKFQPVVPSHDHIPEKLAGVEMEALAALFANLYPPS